MERGGGAILPLNGESVRELAMLYEHSIWLLALTFAPPVDHTTLFVERIAPLLRHKCLSCHSGKKPKGNLDLTTREKLLHGGDSGAVVVSGKSGESLLYEHVRDEVMPPKDPLTVAEIEALRQWIDAGLSWSGPALVAAPSKANALHWWSFQPLRRPEVPARSSSELSENAIDAFIRDKLTAAGLAPSPPADRRTQIRRACLTLTGLLPEPDEVESFVADDRPDAYERLVDRLIASPRFGERWATHWLDVVRFAETDGFEMNQERPNAYPFRDYVVRAFNSDKPYDRFAFEQLAGDTVGCDEATGYLVAGAFDKVKSPDVVLTLTQRQDELADMVNTTGTAFLGLTVGCARCHDHKFDPISQTDFYAMQAVFVGVQHGERPRRDADMLSRRNRADQIDRQIAGVETDLISLANENRLVWRPPVRAQGNWERFSPLPVRLVRFTVLATNNLEPCIDELEVFAAENDPAAGQNVALKQFGARATSSGDYAGSPLHKLEHIHDGQYGNGRSWISNETGKGWVQIELPRLATINRIQWARDREGKYADRLPVRYTIEVSAAEGSWRTVANSDDRTKQPGNGVGLAFQVNGLTLDESRRAAELLDRLGRLEKERAAIVAVPAVYAGRFEQPGPTHRLFRGDPMQMREPVGPEAIAALTSSVGSLKVSVDAPETTRRAAFAKWLTSPANTLVARVIVNRIWQHHFGVCLVATPSDFGRMGVRPTHPELLDWLAAELVKSGWSLKHVHRLIVTSATYRQSSAPNPKWLANDASCRLLWRYPPHRVEAEAIRDLVLQVAGSLQLSMYGPGFTVFEPNDNYVRVYQPKEAWGPAEWRRMVYMHRVRMERDPVFGPFDCPDAGLPTANRSRSTTAFQSLNLLNSGFVAQQSEHMSRRLELEAGTDRGAQIRYGFALAFNRFPEPDEFDAASQLAVLQGLPAVCRALLNANELLFVP